MILRITPIRKDKKYNVVYADPPWRYNDKMKSQGGGAEGHYQTMNIEEIKALDVEGITTEDATLFIWVTFPLLQEGLDVIKAWGFKYKTVAFTWVKRNQTNDSYFLGMGHWTRSNAELCLLGVKGKPKRVSGGVRSVLDSRRLRHSEKPNEARQRIVKLMGDVPRIELFARDHREGFDIWGNELRNDIELLTRKN